MFPLDPASGPGEGSRGQAMAHGGTFVRPGAIAWGEAPGRPGRGPSSTDEWIAAHARPFYIRDRR